MGKRTGNRRQVTGPEPFWLRVGKNLFPCILCPVPCNLILSPVFCLLFSVCILFVARPSYGQWAATYGGAKNDYANFIQQTREGGYIVAGDTKSFGAGGRDAWVLKFRTDGQVEWQKTYGGDKDDWACSIRQTGDGGYAVAGGTESFGAGDTDAWVLKLTSNGTVEWQKTYGGTVGGGPNLIQQTADGGYIVAGWVGEGLPDSGKPLPDFKVKFWLLKPRAEGSVEWQKTYERGDFNRLSSFQQTGDGGYVMAGETSSRGCLAALSSSIRSSFAGS